MDETKQLYDGRRQETRDAIDALGADVMRFATELEAQLKKDFRVVESRFETGHVKNYDEFFYETMCCNIPTLSWVDSEMGKLMERNKKLREEMIHWVVRAHTAHLQARAEAAEAARIHGKKPGPTTD